MPVQIQVIFIVSLLAVSSLNLSNYVKHPISHQKYPRHYAQRRGRGRRRPAALPACLDAFLEN